MIEMMKQMYSQMLELHKELEKLAERVMLTSTKRHNLQHILATRSVFRADEWEEIAKKSTETMRIAMLKHLQEVITYDKANLERLKKELQ